MSTLTSSSSSSPSSPNTKAISKPNFSDQDSKLQIFLGGSCNPTTWRQNVAIPYLEMNGISYYNPQVDNWTPELVNSERYAKQKAQILLFVIDRQTRSTVGLVESAFIAGEDKNLILVIYPFEYNITSCTDRSDRTSNIISTRSRLLQTSRTLKKKQGESSSFMESSSSSSSTLISSSLCAQKSNLTATATRSSSTKTVLTSEKITSSASADNCEFDERSLRATHEEAEQASGTIMISDEVISPNEFHELQRARYILQNLMAIKKIPMFPDILQALKYVSHSLSDTAIEAQHGGAGCGKSLTNAFSSESHTSMNLMKRELTPEIKATTSDQKSPKNEDAITDVYLSLDSEDYPTIESTVIAILKEKGLTYNYSSVNSVMTSIIPSSPATVAMSKLSIDSQMSVNTNELTRYSNTPGIGDNTKLAIEKEMCAIRKSRVLLFIITNKCRGLSIMVLASHFMALFRNNVVLCVQYLEEPCSIGGENLTKTAIADYNRGRVYLCDYAIKSQVPVFSTIREAIECCNRKCRHDNKN